MCRFSSNDILIDFLFQIPGVIGVHELHIWRLTPQKTLATVHIVFNTTDDILTKYQDITLIFQTFYIDHVTIQPEFSLVKIERDISLTILN